MIELKAKSTILIKLKIKSRKSFAKQVTSMCRLLTDLQIDSIFLFDQFLFAVFLHIYGDNLIVGSIHFVCG